jgi:hypothetical protein
MMICRIQTYFKLHLQYFLKRTAEHHETSHDSLLDENSIKNLRNMKQECHPLHCNIWSLFFYRFKLEYVYCNGV